MKFGKLLGFAALAAGLSGPAAAAAFVNGGFEDGNTNGWTTGGIRRTDVLNPSLNPADVLAGGPATRSSIISAGALDPRLGSRLGSTVYSGNYSYRVEDANTGGYASAISQSVLNYTDSSIFFAWKAVIEGAHGDDDSALFKLVLRDDTTGTELISRSYNGSGSGGVDSRFSSYLSYFYTPQWQIEQLSIDAALSGHDFTLSLLAADCEPTGHRGYAYLDGFGAVLPPVTVPLPGTLALLGLGLAGLGVARKRKQA